MENKNQDFEQLINETFLHLDFEKERNSELVRRMSESIFERNSFWTKSMKTYFGIGISILIMGFSYFFSINKKAALYQPNQVKITQNNVENKIPQLRKITSASFINFEDSPRGKPVKANKLVYDFTTLIEEKKDSIKVYHGKEVFELPELTEAQINEHEKVKADFLKDIAKLKDQRLQDFKVVIQDSIYNLAVWTGEVTNSEYRIFLNDLILKKEKEKYLVAYIDSVRWMSAFQNRSFFEPMRDMYAWHPAYDNYPVVNISAKGSELFCEWLTNEIKKLDKNKNDLIKARLMNYQEWQYIYTSGGKYKPYPWGGPYVRNKVGEFLANYRPYKTDYSADGALTTINSKYYAPNELGLYNLAGNVSEWIKVDKNLYAAMGGSWADPAHIMKYDAVVIDTVKAAHPTIGFRPVIELSKQ